MLSPLWGMTSPVTLNFVQKQRQCRQCVTAGGTQGWSIKREVCYCVAAVFINLSTLLLSTRDTPVSTKAGIGDVASNP